MRKTAQSKKKMSAAESEESKELLLFEKESWRNCKSGGRWGGGGALAKGGVSDITFMNQCQQSDEKIIKKQARSVLNTAKGKRPILLYWSTVWMEENGNKWKQEEKSCRKKKSIS